MKIQNAHRAVVDIVKLRDYCLNKRHPRGKHKAWLFESILGLTDVDAEELQDTLLEIVQTNNAVEGRQDQYGKRYVIDFTMIKAMRQTAVRSSWIMRSDEDFPRLTSCYVLKD